MKIIGKTCYAYFRGRDGEGTCDTECQWYPGENGVCPMQIPREDWDTESDLFRQEGEG